MSEAAIEIPEFTVPQYESVFKVGGARSPRVVIANAYDDLMRVGDSVWRKGARALFALIYTALPSGLTDQFWLYVFSELEEARMLKKLYLEDSKDLAVRYKLHRQVISELSIRLTSAWRQER